MTQLSLFDDYRPGRPPKAETLRAMEDILNCVKSSPEGIYNARVAKQIGITSDRSSVLARRLEERGLIRIERTQGALKFLPVNDFKED